MEIKKNIRNELFKRQEVSFLIEDSKTPSIAEAKKMISIELKKPEENIDVYNIFSNFGKKTFLIESFIYDTKQDLEKALILRKTKKQRLAEKKAEEERLKAELEAKKKAEESANNN